MSSKSEESDEEMILRCVGLGLVRWDHLKCSGVNIVLIYNRINLFGTELN